MIQAVQVPIPADGQVHPVKDVDADSPYGDAITFKNTGSVTLLLGGKADGSDAVFPMDPLDVWATDLHGGDVLYAKVQSGATAGEMCAIKSK